MCSCQNPTPSSCSWRKGTFRPLSPIKLHVSDLGFGALLVSLKNVCGNAWRLEHLFLIMFPPVTLCLHFQISTDSFTQTCRKGLFQRINSVWLPCKFNCFFGDGSPQQYPENISVSRNCLYLADATSFQVPKSLLTMQQLHCNSLELLSSKGTISSACHLSFDFLVKLRKKGFFF